MNCEQFSYLLDDYLQDSLTHQQASEMEHHLSNCDDCRLLLQIRKDCRELNKGFEMPENFSSSWRQAIREQEESNMSEHPENKRSNLLSLGLKRWFAVAASLVFVIGGTWMVSQSMDKNTANSPRDAVEQYSEGYGGLADYARGAVPAQKMAADQFVSTVTFMSEDQASPEADNVNPQKIIRTMSINLITRSFDEDLIKLNDAMVQEGGYVEYSNISGDRGSRRYASMTLRIPKDKLDSYLQKVKGFGRVTSITESQEDVSEQYSDTKTRLLTQTTKLTRLQELMTQANLVEDILDIERELADTQYEVDRLTGSLRGLDSKVDYSTVQLSLQEEIPTTEPTELGLGEQIKLAVSDAWQITFEFLKNLLVLIVVALPYVLVLVLLIVVIKKNIWRKKK